MSDEIFIKTPANLTVTSLANNRLKTDNITQEEYELVPDNDELLSTVLVPFDFVNQLIPSWELAVNLVSTMKKHNGLGLAANQVGMPFRVFVMDGFTPIACFNPRIVSPVTEFGEEIREEGCLTYPGLYIKVKRWKVIRVRYQDADGNAHSETFTGMTARVFQHELDHLDGITYLERATRFHKDQAMNKWKIWKRRNVK